MKRGLVLLLGWLAVSVMPVQAAPITFTAALDGLSESPSNASPGTGFATVTIDDTLHTLEVEVTFAGLLGGVTASHIHVAPTAQAGSQTAAERQRSPKPRSSQESWTAERA